MHAHPSAVESVGVVHSHVVCRAIVLAVAVVVVVVDFVFALRSSV